MPAVLSQSAVSVSNNGPSITIDLLPDELWWGGTVSDGRYMPFGDAPFARNLSTAGTSDNLIPTASNQSAPLLVSTKGRYLWSEGTFVFSFEHGTLHANCTSPDGQIVIVQTDGNLREAYLAASRNHFPASQRTPAMEMLTKPQYNTWIEMPYQPTQDKVLNYAHTILDTGMPAGTIMIDDKWCPDYGDWTFDRSAFPDPQSMIGHLHNLGFHVMLWLVPFVSPDSATFRDLEAKGLLLRDHTGDTAVRRWWNGLSALLDLSNPDTIAWLSDSLDSLRALGVDGFKFDGADFYDFHDDDRPHHALTPAEYCERWASIGLDYPFNEFRACWRMGGQPLAQRLKDKPPLWTDDGIGALVPELLAQSMIGHPFTCPDMIGGGEVNDADHVGNDQEFFVRYAQIAALSPMMQFSVSPSRVLDDDHLSAVNTALRIRDEHMPLIEELAQYAAETGEPIMRPMAYHYDGFDKVNDQFLLGDKLIVAPVTEQGVSKRRVAIPHGTWLSDLGERIVGPTTITTPVDIERIPRFRKVE
ncbi:glycoside hydrolase family 31 protein [Bifidobacterium oedipodis]|uniref:Glycoside hydrolase family 31 n=1 Tax=Bifidobacterium oedipodis TaxID=2675322 RepID=A0A7Y0ERC6_9BIFI|nr:glycoside hydrolase family 31 protein [Bifidobacterium sp. DSM 109957]NMM94558.1 glycoside hydrolase family 31 [Bifidobacterium sp. DSM 109957]